MLTFEEYFKKKKIDLAALHAGEPALFMEFASHYDQMGEKSFDHVKKYWFNKLRKQYHLAPEIKAEPIRNENQLVEQTVFDSLAADPAENTPKQGFTPRFKTAAPKPAEPTPAAEDAATQPAEQAPPKPAFTPRFKAHVTKPAEAPSPAEDSTDKPAEPAPAKPGFTPRFKPGVTKPVGPVAESVTEKPAEQNIEDENPADGTVAEAPKKPGFTPRFKAGVTKPAAPTTPTGNSTEKSVEATPEPAPAQQPRPKNNVVIGPPEDANVPEFDFTGKAAPKPPVEPKPADARIDKMTEQADRLASDFKNRFKAKHLPKNTPRLKPGEAADDSPAAPAAPEVPKNKEVDKEKAAYKPRFNAKKLPPKE